MVYLVDSLDVTTLFKLFTRNNGMCSMCMYKTDPTELVHEYHKTQWFSLVNTVGIAGFAQVALLAALHNSDLYSCLRSLLEYKGLTSNDFPEHLDIEDVVVIVKEGDDHALEWYLIRP